MNKRAQVKEQNKDLIVCFKGHFLCVETNPCTMIEEITTFPYRPKNRKLKGLNGLNWQR